MRVMAACLVLLVASTASAQDAPEYRDVRAARPDGRTIQVKDLVLERDAYRITLQSGAVHLLTPLGQNTFGAVFIGQGNYLLSPATEAERRTLQLVSNSTEGLRDRVTRMILLCPAYTEAVVRDQAPTAAGWSMRSSHRGEHISPHRCSRSATPQRQSAKRSSSTLRS